MDSICASTLGIQLVDQARRQRNWNKTANIWSETAQVSRSTLNRFWQRQAIEKENFINICKVVGVDWREVAEPQGIQEDPNLPRQQRGIYIPNTRCRQVWGRDTLIAQILDYLCDTQEASILSLSGGAGYGKTELATQIAHQALNQNKFADVLWVTARQSEWIAGTITSQERQTALNWKQFLDEIARQLDSPLDQVQRYLRQKPYMLILDNAETADVENILAQLVRWLNPSRALLTSRLQTNPPFVKLIPITGLELKWSSQLLHQEAQYQNIPSLLEASNKQLQRIHTLSCGVPLALHFVVSRVLHDRALEPILTELEQAKGEVEDFYGFCFTTAWQRLNETAKNVLRRLGMMDASVNHDFLVSGWQFPETELQTALGSLRRWHLLEDQEEKTGHRYTLHPWIRSSVRNCLVDNWQPSLQELQQFAQWQFGVNFSLGDS